MKKFFATNWKLILCIASFGMLLFAIENSIYHFLFPTDVRPFWILIPCALYILSLFLKRFIKQKTSCSFFLEFINLFALLALYLNIVFPVLGEWYKTNYSIIVFITALIVLCATIILKMSAKSDISTPSAEDETLQTQNLFNIFYLNTSKAHEIAMLIDNKIIKAIESEHVAENTQKSNVSLGTGSSHIISSESSISSEEVSKQRVFESFDVKQTKSIMLRKIYETISSQEGTISEGKLILIKNVELQQMNVDDTVMILNVLQDSKLKNRTDDNIEINLNKMIDKMLDDFTIDYCFEHNSIDTENRKYIIRLPYKSMTNFENGYQHNDLQLGKLSIIGIYRGEIDFSEKESVSSKFLELLSSSYKQQNNPSAESYGMKLSHTGGKANTVDFNFEHKKLGEKLHLVDVISIIQEISF